MLNLDDKFAFQKMIDIEGDIAMVFVSCNYVEMGGKFSHTVGELAFASQDIDFLHQVYGDLHRN